MSWINYDTIKYKLLFNVDNQNQELKIAGFDFDYTIAQPFKTIHPKSADDWKYSFVNVKQVLQELHENGFLIVVFSNQLRCKGEQEKMILQRFDNVLNDINVPISMYVSHKNDNYRKPNKGMFELLKTHFNTKNISKESFYVGDAAGRCENYSTKTKKDFSCADRKFAYNLDLKFYTPEEFFLHEEPNKNYFMNTMDELKTIEGLDRYSLYESEENNNKQSNNECVILVGCPASGKSYYVNNKLSDYVRINQDILKTKKKCIEKCEQALQEKKNIVIDNTNPDLETRKNYIDLCNKYNVSVNCLYFLVSDDLFEHLNNFKMKIHKTEKISKLVHNKFYKKLIQPSVEEGFYKVGYISFVPEFTNEEHKKIFYELS